MGYEPDVEVEVTRCRVTRFEDDLDPFHAGLDQPSQTGGEHVAGQSPILVVVLGAHWLDQAGGAHLIAKPRVDKTARTSSPARSTSTSSRPRRRLRVRAHVPRHAPARPVKRPA